MAALVSVGAIIGIALASAIAGAALLQLGRWGWRTVGPREQAEIDWTANDHPHYTNKIAPWKFCLQTLSNLAFKYKDGSSDPHGLEQRKLIIRVSINQWLGGWVRKGSFHSPPGFEPRAFEEMKALAGDAEEWETQIELCHSQLGSDTIHAYLVRVLVARIQPTCGLDTTLLPPPLVRMWQMISAEGPGGQEQQMGMNELDEDIGHDWWPRAMWNLWRAFTVRWIAHEFPIWAEEDNEGRPFPLPASDERMPNIIKVEQELLRTLRPLGPGVYGTIDTPKSLAILRGIIEQFAYLGLYLFAMARETRLVWPEDYHEAGDDRTICFFPEVWVRSHLIDEMTMITGENDFIMKHSGDYDDLTSIGEAKLFAQPLGHGWSPEEWEARRKARRIRVNDKDMVKRDARKKELKELSRERKAAGMQRWADDSN